MDVHCATCGEPWDTYHLWQDEVHETEAGQAIINENSSFAWWRWSDA